MTLNINFKLHEVKRISNLRGKQGKKQNSVSLEPESLASFLLFITTNNNEDILTAKLFNFYVIFKKRAGVCYRV